MGRGHRTQIQLEASADVGRVLTNLQAPKNRTAIDQGADFKNSKQSSYGFHFLVV